MNQSEDGNGTTSRNGNVHGRATGMAKNAPEKPVGLNLVTDFSRPLEGPAAPTFVDLNDLKMLSKERAKERTAQKGKGNLFKKRAGHGSGQLPDEASMPEEGQSYLNPGQGPSGKRRDELSPSDRPMMIGYTVPFDKSSDSQKDSPKEPDSAESHAAPTTPSIVVTPAKEGAYWSRSSADYRRPRSSVYSQPTPLFDSAEMNIPPVPALPELPASDRSPDLATRKRSQSTGTVFEEDANPWLGRRSRSYSEDYIKRASDVSLVSKRQSQGWWTYLLSPLLDRSNTVASRQTPETAERPSTPSTSSDTTEWWEKDEKEVSCFSPDTPEAAGSRGIIGSRNLDYAATRNDNENDTGSPVERGVASVGFPGSPIYGAAAEYYQACAHELFSGRPYFECVNHECSITPQDQINAVTAAAADMPHDGGLAFDNVDTSNGSKNPFTQNPFKPYARFSGSTAVGDTDNPFDGANGIDAPGQATGESSKVGSPMCNDKELPQTPQPARVYPREKRTPPSRSRTASPPKEPPMTPEPARVYPREKQTPLSQSRTASPPDNHQRRSSPSPPPRAAVYPGYHAQLEPPGMPSPGPQYEAERGGSIPLSEVPGSPLPPYQANENYSYPIVLPHRYDPYAISRADLVHPVTERDRIEAQRRRLEREDAIGRRAGGLWRGRGPVSRKGCFGRPGREGRLRRRWYMVIAAFFLIIVVVAIALATTLTKEGHRTPVESRWLNLTGYPPMPTGIATIAGPKPQVQNSGCIHPPSLWSCALPQEQHAANKPYPADEPNFRVSILFRNGTYQNSTRVVSNSTQLHSKSRNFTPSPPPPSLKDQTFLGNTTDHNVKPYAGEETPFFITVLSPIDLSSSHLSRRSSFPNLSAIIPDPAANSDGTAAPAKLYPLPESQPIRLYNRGAQNEHYGFYTYYDKSIFLETRAPVTGTRVTNPADKNGGSSAATARVRCIWAQARFLVQIWTRPGQAGMDLLEPSSSTASSSSTSANPPPFKQHDYRDILRKRLHPPRFLPVPGNNNHRPPRRRSEGENGLLPRTGSRIKV